MKHSLLTLFSSVLLLVPALHAQELNIFNGKDLSGWKGLMEFWSVRDGAITGELTARHAPAKNTFLVWGGGKLSDFEFSCKYRLITKNAEGRANSGIQFRSSYTGPQGFDLKGYQGEMDPGLTRAKGASLSGCLIDDPPGTLIAQADAKAVASYRAGDWNDYRIVAVGSHIQIFVNGMLSVDAQDSRYTTGLIGLQLHRRSAPYVVQFKDIKLRGIEAGNAASGTMPPVPKGSPSSGAPNPSMVETLSQQAPNAVAWVIAPLDQHVPPDIRQNLTFLLEDLLDEGTRTPKTGAAAYKAGEQLCRTMIAALDERKQALAAAGFRAVEAGARTGVTSQALEARRNYLMSWPQYAREQAQRAELKSQAVSSAAIIAERPKLEWTQRTAVIQRQLDALYAQFRDALRKSPDSK